MHFESDDLPISFAEGRQLGQRAADLFERLGDRDFFRQTVRADFDAAAAAIMTELDERFRFFDLLLQLGGVG